MARRPLRWRPRWTLTWGRCPGSPRLPTDRRMQSGEEADDGGDHTLELEVARVDRLHAGVLRLEAHPPGLAVEALDGHLALPAGLVLDPCDHDGAVRRRLAAGAHHHQVAVT